MINALLKVPVAGGDAAYNSKVKVLESENANLRKGNLALAFFFDVLLCMTDRFHDEKR